MIDYEIKITGLKDKNGNDYTNTDFNINSGVFTITSLSTELISNGVKDSISGINISKGGSVSKQDSFSFQIDNVGKSSGNFFGTLKNDGVFFTGREVFVTTTIYDQEFGMNVDIPTYYGKVSTTPLKKDVLTINCISAVNSLSKPIGSDLSPFFYGKVYNSQIITDGVQESYLRVVSTITGDPVDFNMYTYTNSGTTSFPNYNYRSIYFITANESQDFLDAVSDIQSGSSAYYMQAVQTEGGEVFQISKILSTDNGSRRFYNFNLLGAVDFNFNSEQIAFRILKKSLVGTVASNDVILHDELSSTESPLKTIEGDIFNSASYRIDPITDEVHVTYFSPEGDLRLSNVKQANLVTNVSYQSLVGKRDSVNDIGLGKYFGKLIFTEDDFKGYDDISLRFKGTLSNVLNSIPSDDTLRINMDYGSSLDDIKYNGIGDASNFLNDSDNVLTDRTFVQLLNVDEGKYITVGLDDLDTTGNGIYKIVPGTISGKYSVEIDMRFMLKEQLNNYYDFKTPPDTSYFDTIDFAFSFMIGDYIDNGDYIDDTAFETTSNFSFDAYYTLNKTVGSSELLIGAEETTGTEQGYKAIRKIIDDYTFGSWDSETFNSYDPSEGLYDQPKVGKQINERSDAIDELEEICNSVSAGLIVSRSGPVFKIKNFMSAIQRFDFEPSAIFDQSDYKILGEIIPQTGTESISDIQQEYDYNYSTKEFKSSIRVAGADQLSFNDAILEGVEPDQISEDTWNNLRANYLRTGQINQNKDTELKNITRVKGYTEDSTNPYYAQQRAYWRSFWGYTKEYAPIITKYNAENLRLELLDVIAVKHKRHTDDIYRLAWIDQITHNPETQLLKFKLCFSLYAWDDDAKKVIDYDPFILAS